MKNQLFKIIPGTDILMKLLNLFNITTLNDECFFDKKIIKTNSVVDKLTKLKKEFSKYYLDNKYRYFFKNINETRCITILRQLLKVNNYSLKKEKNIYYIKKNKKTYYIICFD
jgi:hypothetical protein